MNNFILNPTNQLEIIDTINNLNSNKVSGPDSIHYKILHLIKLNIADTLSKIINLSFEIALDFDKLNVSKAIPVFKDKGDILHSINY